jgi:hypothetical protein
MLDNQLSHRLELLHAGRQPVARLPAWAAARVFSKREGDAPDQIAAREVHDLSVPREHSLPSPERK